MAASSSSRKALARPRSAGPGSGRSRNPRASRTRASSCRAPSTAGSRRSRCPSRSPKEGSEQGPARP